MPYKKKSKKQWGNLGRIGKFNSVVRLNDVQKLARTAISGYKMASTAMSLLNVELKHFDTDNTIYPYTGAFLSTGLFQIAQGDADNQRNGEKLRIKSLHIQGSVVKNAAVANTLIKIVLVKCPTIHSDTSPQTEVYTTQSMTSFRNMDFTKKYSVIWTKTISLNSIKTKQLFDKYIKLDIPVSYTAAGADTIEANGYFLMITSDQINNASSIPTFNFKTRVRYIDN